MPKIILFSLIALVTWLILIVAGGQDRYAEILGAEASGLEVIMGIVGATIICHVLVYTSSAR